MQSAKTKTLCKFGTKTHRTDSPILCCFTQSGSCYRIHRKRSMQGPFQKRNLLSLLKVPDEQILEVEKKKTKQWANIFRSFSILPSHLTVGTSKTVTTIFRDVYKDIPFVIYCKAFTRSQSAGLYKQIKLVQCMNLLPAVSEVLLMLNSKLSL